MVYIHITNEEQTENNESNTRWEELQEDILWHELQSNKE